MRLLLTVVTLLLVAGCGTVRQDVARDDAIRHYLNDRDYEQAIGLLRERIEANPKDDAAKIMLASAYSGSVGINTIDCFEVLRPKLFDRPLATQALMLQSLGAVAAGAPEAPASDAVKPVTLEEKKRQAVRVIEKELLKFASQSADALEIAFRLPHVPLGSRDRIVLSLAILGEIDESSDQYLTAQLYQGILGLVQFMNYFRDGLPVKTSDRSGSQAWYLGIYCQMDLGILLPNLSQGVDYMAASFASFANAGRKSDNPIYANLIVAAKRLTVMNRSYLQNEDLFEFADWSLRASKDSVCE